VETNRESAGEPGDEEVAMKRQQASMVVAAPLAVVERTLTDVSRWPEFLSGVDEVKPTGFERYRFTVSGGGNRREVPVCVTPHPAEHRISWHALEGPRYLGEIRLHLVDDAHTRVDLTMSADPVGILDGFSEMLGERHRTVELDLRRLDRLLATG
jgi:uncharacterized membrane protein